MLLIISELFSYQHFESDKVGEISRRIYLIGDARNVLESHPQLQLE